MGIREGGFGGSWGGGYWDRISILILGWELRVEVEGGRLEILFVDNLRFCLGIVLVSLF